jgi:hypothetical protein
MLQRDRIGLEGVRIFRNRLSDILVREGIQAFPGSLGFQEHRPENVRLEGMTHWRTALSVAKQRLRAIAIIEPK